MLKRVLLPLLLGSSLAVAQEPSLDPTTSEIVREVGRWLAAQAQSVERGKGVVFPEYAEKPDETPSSVYAGSAGVLIFLENAAAILDDSELRKLADRTAVGLLAARSGEGAPTWAAGRGAGGAGLYTGDAGVAHAFLVRARLRNDRKALAVARQIADGLLERSQTRGDTRWWDSSYDIIGGAAGTLLVLLDLGAETGNARYLDAAADAGRWLARAGQPDAEGDASTRGERLWWPARAGGERHYPNFSHGTAGIGYALARVAQATGDEECLAAAVAGAEWLLAHAIESDEGICWFHSTPGREERLMEGWCHGPSGTARTFFALAAVTGEERFAQAALGTTDWILGTKVAPSKVSGGARFYSPSLCCGAAGVLDTVIDVYRATGDERYASYAREVAAYLVRLSKEDEHGRKWTNYNRPDEEGLIYHSPSLMLGASGEALALLRLAALELPADPVEHLPDRALLGQD